RRRELRRRRSLPAVLAAAGIGSPQSSIGQGKRRTPLVRILSFAGSRLRESGVGLIVIFRQFHADVVEAMFARGRQSQSDRRSRGDVVRVPVVLEVELFLRGL